MISVIIPLYNKASYIANTVEMVLRQTMQNFELIVVNDGSTDDSIKKLEKFNDERIKILNKDNGGVSSARNYGIKHAKYELIAFLDADDHWYTGHLDNIMKLISEYPNAHIYSSNFEYINSNSIKIRANKINKSGYIVNFFKIAIENPVIHTSAVVVHSSAFKEVGYFDERMIMGEDIEMWYRIIKKFNLVYSTEVTVSYLLDTENNINSNPNKVPHPRGVFPYYISFNGVSNIYEFRWLKRRIYGRTLRYLKDKKFEYFLIILKQQWRNYFRIYKGRMF